MPVEQEEYMLITVARRSQMAFGLFKKKEVADLILINGKIRTLLIDDPEVESLAISGGRIIAMGDQEGILSDFEDEQTELIDLEGGVVLPGFILMKTAKTKKIAAHLKSPLMGSIINVGVATRKREADPAFFL